jgi:hypothetical protein
MQEEKMPERESKPPGYWKDPKNIEKAIGELESYANIRGENIDINAIISSIKDSLLYKGVCEYHRKSEDKKDIGGQDYWIWGGNLN